MKCPNCSFENEQNSSRCFNCGQPLSNDTLSSGIVIFDDTSAESNAPLSNGGFIVDQNPLVSPTMDNNVEMIGTPTMIETPSMIETPMIETPTMVETPSVIETPTLDVANQNIAFPNSSMESINDTVDTIDETSETLDEEVNIFPQPVEVSSSNEVPQVNSNVSQDEEIIPTTSSQSNDIIIPTGISSTAAMTPEVVTQNVAPQVENVSVPENNQVFVQEQAAPSETPVTPVQETPVTQEAEIELPKEASKPEAPKAPKVKGKFFLDLETIFIVLVSLVAAYFLIQYLPLYLEFNNYADKLGSSLNLGYYFDTERPILYKNNDTGLYYYIRATGGNLFDASYTYASEFYGNYAIVSADPEDPEYETYKYYFINKKGKVVLKVKTLESVVNDKNNNVYLIDGVLYNQNLKRITDEELEVSYFSGKFYKYINNNSKKQGVISTSGVILYEFEKTPDSYTLLNKTNSKSDNYLEVLESNNNITSVKYVALSSGKVVFQLENTHDYTYYFNEGLIEWFKTNIPEKRNYLFLHEGEEIYRVNDVFSASYVDDYRNILLIQELSDTKYYYDPVNKKKYDELPEDLKYDDDEYRYGYKIIYDEQLKKYGLVNKKDETVLANEYDSIKKLSLPLYLYIQNRSHSDIYILEKRDDFEVIVYDARAGKVLETVKDAKITIYDDSSFAVFTILDNGQAVKRIIYNLITLDKTEIGSSEDLKVYNNYVSVTGDKFNKLYNTRLTNFFSDKVA